MLNNPRDIRKYNEAKRRMAEIMQQHEQSDYTTDMFTPTTLTPPKTDDVSVEDKQDEITKDSLADKEDKSPAAPGADVPETKSSDAKEEIVDDVDDLQEEVNYFGKVFGSKI